MATFHPNSPPPGSPGSELKVRASLASLDDDWHIFHSVSWQSARGGREADGEADFVLAHKRHGVVILEVKGGEVSINEGRWFSLNRATRETHGIKNPFEQAKDSKHALIRHFEQTLGAPLPFSLCHGAVLPDVTVDDFLGLDAPREITWDGADLAEAATALDRLLKHWGANGPIGPAEMKSIIGSLAPSTQVRTLLRDRISDAVVKLIDLTSQQIGALDRIRRNRRAALFGGAGTGKTVLAVESSRRLAAQGFRVLLTCFNSSLANHLQSELADTPLVTVKSFHGLCFEQARAAGLHIPDDPSQEWWETQAASLLLEAADTTGFRIDALVVDECQDFAGEWLDSLMLQLTDTDNGPVYVFADSHQSIYNRTWSLPEDWPSFDLDVNCRNTNPIAERVAHVFGDPVNTLGVDGPKPQLVRIKSLEDGLQLTAQIVDDLIQSERLGASQIVVLSHLRSPVDQLREMTSEEAVFIPSERVSKSQNGVVAETIHRFKGLESEVVLLLLPDIHPDHPSVEELLYTGMSRAMTMLFVLGPKELAEMLGWGVVAKGD